MKVSDLFSKRARKLRGEVPDVYSYDEIPVALRAQIVHILRDAIGTGFTWEGLVRGAYESVYNALCREYGQFELIKGDKDVSVQAAVWSFLLASESLDSTLDVIELLFRLVDSVVRDDYRFNQRTTISPDEAIDELNYRFKEHGVGYQFESGRLVRIDSQLIHAEVTKPALHLLADKSYSGANEEFLEAHKHYREGRYQECLNECLKAFESTMKIICAKRGWTFGKGDGAQKLIAVCFDNELMPAFLQSEFSSLRALLESGVPTVRNRLSGHGKGVQKRHVPKHVAAYALHMTAANIQFLVESEKALP